MRLTPSDAARLFDIHRATLYRHMASGRLSWVLEPNGSRALDMSELIRCYGEPPSPATPSATHATSSIKDDATPTTERLLGELVELTRSQGEELRRLREEVASLRLLPAPSDNNNTLWAGEDTSITPKKAKGSDDPHGFRAMAKKMFFKEEDKRKKS